jgi:hypothetical protein
LHHDSVIHTLKSRKRVPLLAIVIQLAIVILPTLSFGQVPWSGILNPTRATDWTTAGFTIPSYSTPCSTQPSLSTGSGNAAANTTSINNAIATCDATHNVVNIPAGTYYINGIDYQKRNNVVVRGAGPNSTYLYIESGLGCLGYSGAGAFCMGGNALYAQSGSVSPGNSNVCSWTGGYSQGSTSITLNSCGAGTSLAPGMIIALDQADDSSDTGGIWTCSSFNTVGPPFCQVNSLGNGQNADGRVLNGVQYSEQQFALVTGVSGSGTGPYTVTIAAPGIYFNNIRSSRTPGAWWPTQIANLEGIENLTLDHTPDTTSHYGAMMIWCSQCWVKNIRSIVGALADHVIAVTSYEPVIRDSYWYGSQHSGSGAYCIQMEEVSGGLVENNIMQNTVSPDIKDAVTGTVSGYNFTPYINFGSYLQGMYASHNSGSSFNLLEGNSTTDFIGDDVWGTSDLITIFRDQATGWYPSYVNQTIPIIFNEGVRGTNVIGNVLGQPGYHTQYEVFPTGAQAVVHNFAAGGSTTAGAGAVSQSIYEIGTVDAGGLGNCTANQNCDTISHTSLMRWGNYDTVQNAVTWNSAESAPGAVPYVNANSTPSSHTLPTSFYLSSRPAWFRSVAFPAYGPDVASGTTGMCTSGTYHGIEATASTQCAGGAFTASAWGGHANVNPAQDCYLNVMNGPPDGSGGVLSFDASQCYSQQGSVQPPTDLSAVVQ